MLYDSSTASKIAPELGRVQETSLIPLYARARDAARRHPVLEDERAAELIDGLEYDFTRFGGPSLSGSQPVRARHTVLSGRLPKAV